MKLLSHHLWKLGPLERRHNRVVQPRQRNFVEFRLAIRVFAKFLSAVDDPHFVRSVQRRVFTSGTPRQALNCDEVTHALRELLRAIAQLLYREGLVAAALKS